MVGAVIRFRIRMVIPPFNTHIIRVVTFRAHSSTFELLAKTNDSISHTSDVYLDCYLRRQPRSR